MRRWSDINLNTSLGILQYIQLIYIKIVNDFGFREKLKQILYTWEYYFLERIEQNCI